MPDRETTTGVETEPRILARPDHAISRKLISAGAVKVLYRLKNSGYKAYMCGGAVRDLMLGSRPKDFDVCTDAEPSESAAPVPQRAHHRPPLSPRPRHFLTTASSRSRPSAAPPIREEQKGGPEDLLITSDNVFGTPREDAFRRDFTINALFYNVADFSVIDYVGGIDGPRQSS